MPITTVRISRTLVFQRLHYRLETRHQHRLVQRLANEGAYCQLQLRYRGTRAFVRLPLRLLLVILFALVAPPVPREYSHPNTGFRAEEPLSGPFGSCAARQWREKQAKRTNTAASRNDAIELTNQTSTINADRLKIRAHISPRQHKRTHR
jgi:hypothetical protein